VSTLLSLLAAEAGLRAFREPSEFYVWTPRTVSIFTPIPGLMPGIEGESRFEVNSVGIRGDELAHRHRYRILAMGGSATECLYLDQSAQWPRVVQDELGDSVWVGNAGKSALSTRDNVVQLRHLPVGKLGVSCVVLLIGLNDLQLRLAEDTSYDPVFMQGPRAEATILPHAFASAPEPYGSTFTDLRTTALWRLVETCRRNLSHRDEKNATVQDQQGSFLAWMRQRRREGRFREALPDLRPALGEYERNLDALIEIARARSIRLVLVTQPTIYRPDLPASFQDLLWFGFVLHDSPGGPREFYSIADMEAAMKAYNDTLLRVGRERGVETVDVAALLPRDTRFFYDDAHFTPAGAREVGLILARHFRDREPFAR
jgi:hypothetical protein